jgi:pyruvate dehydrogenase E2 component (dihydrolipoamide acetyltransferase)
MATPILMPRQGQSVESCILTAWKIKAGDTVKSGQPVASIETDKATFEVESPAEGTVLELFFNEGDDIPVLTHIAAIGKPGEDVSELRPGGRASVAAPTLTQPSPAGTPDSAPPVVQSAAPQLANSGISPRARRAAQAAGIHPATLAGSGPGGRIIERDVLAAKAQAPHLSVAARAAGAGSSPPHAAPARAAWCWLRI